MDDFEVRLFIDNEDEQNEELTSLNEKELLQWKIDLEVRALSEYYGNKIKIPKQKN